MDTIVEMITKWNNELHSFGSQIQRDYNDIWDNIKVLSEYKFNNYQPVLTPPEKSFIERLNEWLKNFKPDNQKAMFFLVSKILFITMSQFDFLIDNIYHNHIKRIILEEIIEKNAHIDSFDYKSAQSKLSEEITKTIVVGLTDSCRINDFSHLVKDFDRKNNYFECLLVLLYPTIQKEKNHYLGSKAVLCDEFAEKIINNDPKIKEKTRLIIIEDFSGTGNDILKAVENIEKSSLKFENIIIAPYVISFHSKNEINKQIKKINTECGRSKYHLCYGLEIPENNVCFDNSESYVKLGWIDDGIDICRKIKEICVLKYNENSIEYNANNIPKFGFGNLKIAFVSYYNCPDNTLPIIWFNKNNFNPLFKRSSRII